MHVEFFNIKPAPVNVLRKKYRNYIDNDPYRAIRGVVLDLKAENLDFMKTSFNRQQVLFLAYIVENHEQSFRKQLNQSFIDKIDEVIMLLKNHTYKATESRTFEVRTSKYAKKIMPTYYQFGKWKDDLKAERDEIKTTTINQVKQYEEEVIIERNKINNEKLSSLNKQHVSF